MGALRDLTITQQVGLLFIGLFGLLTAVTLYELTRSLREMPPQQQALHARFKRDLRAVWLGAVLFWVSWVLGAVAATLLFGIVSFLAFREFITLTHTRRADHRSLLLAFFFVLPLQFVLAGSRHFDLFTVFVPVYVFFAIPVISAFGNDPQRFLERTAKIQWGIMVCVYGMSHAPALLLIDLPRYAGRGAFLVFYLVVVVAVAQIVQELASRRLRARPVARAISRSFSWRAWLIGASAAAFVGALLYWATPFKPIPALVMGFIAGATGSLGEFVMKALKRDAGVRSWSGKASVTGAVGLLDRVAPLCFAAPVFFHAVRWYFGL
ncbi:phosphatidate cytidylyltransferase [Piscinibacter sp.]|uniref:phosphatidate cytidylyltransferase n=1 Tax=Piscinibacter sp. TaxID=1903157 RepID=UPI002BB74DE0|nr:phosphatidate cytidylyltransferase [Albitalea sp.]HUG22163.1 phosphatidate cytidylyltransferase [Albitalea sp.]